MGGHSEGVLHWRNVPEPPLLCTSPLCACVRMRRVYMCVCVCICVWCVCVCARARTEALVAEAGGFLPLPLYVLSSPLCSASPASPPPLHVLSSPLPPSLVCLS